MSTADFEQRKRAVINTLNSVLRTGPLKDQDIGQQRLVVLVDQLLERVGPSGPLPLEPLYEYLTERKLDGDDVIETLLALKEREQALDLPLTLPPAIEQMPEDKRQRLLSRHYKRPLQHRAKTPPPTSQPKIPVMERPAGRVARAPTRTKALGAVLGVVALLGGGVLLYLDDGPPAATPVVIDDPSGLACKELKGNQGVLFCWMERATYERIGPSERKTRGLATKAAAAKLGYNTLQVWTLEDSKLREVH